MTTMTTQPSKKRKSLLPCWVTSAPLTRMPLKESRRRVMKMMLSPQEQRLGLRTRPPPVAPPRRKRKRHYAAKPKHHHHHHHHHHAATKRNNGKNAIKNWSTFIRHTDIPVSRHDMPTIQPWVSGSSGNAVNTPCGHDAVAAAATTTTKRRLVAGPPPQRQYHHHHHLP